MNVNTGNEKQDHNKVSVKPIRGTVLEFENYDEMKQFIDYANSKRKTADPGLDKIRNLLKTHKRAPKKK